MFYFKIFRGVGVSCRVFVFSFRFLLGGLAVAVGRGGRAEIMRLIVYFLKVVIVRLGFRILIYFIVLLDLI